MENDEAIRLILFVLILVNLGLNIIGLNIISLSTKLNMNSKISELENQTAYLKSKISDLEGQSKITFIDKPNSILTPNTFDNFQIYGCDALINGTWVQNLTWAECERLRG